MSLRGKSSVIVDDAHHILAPDDSGQTLCGQDARKLYTLPPDLTVWPDGNAACWTCWDVRRTALAEAAL